MYCTPSCSSSCGTRPRVWKPAARTRRCCAPLARSRARPAPEGGAAPTRCRPPTHTHTRARARTRRHARATRCHARSALAQRPHGQGQGEEEGRRQGQEQEGEGACDLHRGRGPRALRPALRRHPAHADGPHRSRRRREVRRPHHEGEAAWRASALPPSPPASAGSQQHARVAGPAPTEGHTRTRDEGAHARAVAAGHAPRLTRAARCPRRALRAALLLGPL